MERSTVFGPSLTEGRRYLETLIRARKIVEDRNAGRPPNTEGIAPLALTFKANADSYGLTIIGLHAIWGGTDLAPKFKKFVCVSIPAERR
jgi:hypothetical protein